jgi:hypothetical protein
MMGTNLGPDLLDAIFFIGVIVFAIIGLYKLFVSNRSRFLIHASIIVTYIGLWVIGIKTGNTFIVVVCAVLAFPFFLFLMHLGSDTNDNRDKNLSFSEISAPAQATPRSDSDKLAHQKAALEREKHDLVQEKEELERQKALDAEREQLAAKQHKIEAGLQQLAVGKQPSASAVGEFGRDGRFLAYNNGTVLDTVTNLMWAAKDNGSNINWADAKSYCVNYRGGGYQDWRMPTQDELAELYDGSKTNHDGAGITDLIEITNYWVWASETSGPDAADFDFYGGNWNLDPQTEVDVRALPVRSAKRV